MSPSPAPTSIAAVTARCLAAALVAALGSLALAQGQQPPPRSRAAGQPAKGQPPAAQEQRPTFRTEANFVRVDVYPTAGGKPVTDLKQEDFEVLEDNVPQEVRTFEHVVVQAPTSEEMAARPEPNTVEQSRQMAAESKARLFVLYLDTYHISRSGAMSVRDALVRFLRKGARPGRPDRGHDARVVGVHADLRAPHRDASRTWWTSSTAGAGATRLPSTTRSKSSTCSAIRRRSARAARCRRSPAR